MDKSFTILNQFSQDCCEKEINEQDDVLVEWAYGFVSFLPSHHAHHSGRHMVSND